MCLGNYFLARSRQKNENSGKDGANGENGTNGKNGSTPYVGENGNWWIDDVDTGMIADYSSHQFGTDGLYFETTTLGGKAGMAVVGYHGESIEVIIPDFVGSIPVIGIKKDAFAGNTRISSIIFSSNIIHLDSGAFKDCTSLISVDFKDAPLSVIPRMAFMNTQLTEVRLPDSVRELEEYSFSQTPLKSINTDGITVFESYCLDCFAGRFIYLSKEVESVETNAFLSTFVYCEVEIKPDSFAVGINADNSINVIYGAKRNANYIYGSDGESVSIYQYIGEEKQIYIPESIDGNPVKRIGYGFASVTDVLCEKLAAMGADLPFVAEEIIIPAGTTEIDYMTFVNCGSVIYIPESVDAMWICTEMPKRAPYYAFASEDAPSFFKSSLDHSGQYDNDVTKTKDAVIRSGFGIDPTMIVKDTDNNRFYLKDENGLSLIAIMSLFSEEVDIEGRLGELTVHTVKKDALTLLGSACTVRILDGVRNIESDAIGLSSINKVYISDTVVQVERDAFGENIEGFYLEAEAIPDSWDELWTGFFSEVFLGVSIDN